MLDDGIRIFIFFHYLILSYLLLLFFLCMRASQYCCIFLNKRGCKECLRRAVNWTCKTDVLNMESFRNCISRNKPKTTRAFIQVRQFSKNFSFCDIA